MRGNLRTLLRKFCGESSILGLKYFYLYPDYFSRCFWAATMVGTLTAACLLSHLLYGRFMETPTRITIESQHEPMHDFPFPAVTLCSPNQLTVSFMRHFNKTLVDGDLDIDLYRVLPFLLGYYQILGNISDDDANHFQSLLDRNRYTINEVMGLMPQSCESFLKTCYFEKRKYPNCISLFSPILTPNGMCCTFNNYYYYNKIKNVPDPDFANRTVLDPEVESGLIVIADFNPEDAIGGALINAGAVRVLFTDSGAFPYHPESVLLEGSTESGFTINGAYTYCTGAVKSLPLANRNCYFDDEKTLQYFPKYHQSDCEIECFLNTVQQQCGCLLFITPDADARRFCDVTKIRCIVQVHSKVKAYDAAQCDCLPDCEYRQYKVDMTIGNLDAMPYVLNDIFANEVYNKSSMTIRFFFTKSVYVKKKQETVMSLILLFSNLGGVFGLCLGFSFISLMEIFFYIYIVTVKRKRFKSKRKVRRPRVHVIEYLE